MNEIIWMMIGFLFFLSLYLILSSGPTGPNYDKRFKLMIENEVTQLKLHKIIERLSQDVDTSHAGILDTSFHYFKFEAGHD